MTSNVISGSPAGSPHQVACGKRDIHQRGVFGDGEGCESGDENEKKEASIRCNK